MLFVGGAFYEPILSSPDYLDNAYPNRIIVIIGILLEFTKVPAIALIPVFLFPILRRHDEVLALGYVGFRLLEVMLYIVSLIGKLSLVNVSQGYLSTGGMDASCFQNIGSSIQSGSDWTFTMAIVAYTLGALMFYSVLYRLRLIPRFISAWGFIAAAVMLIGTLLAMFDLITADSVLGIIVMLPIPVNETVLAIWLIAKGFSPSAIDSGAA